MKDKKDWLNEFVEKNAWPIMVLVIGMALFYANVNSSITAQAREIDYLKEAIIDIVQNQKDIIILQQKSTQVDGDITEIKESLKDIKKSMGLF